ncbi:MAG: hypothetical protein R2752_20740 [Vicinamibacterales bacterium]
MIPGRLSRAIAAARRALLAGLTAAAVACGGSGHEEAIVPPGPADAAAVPATPPVPLVAHERLGALLPDAPDGWTRGGFRTAALTLPAPATHATATYTRGAIRADLAITDTAGQQEFLEATLSVAGTDFDQQASNGYQKGTTVAGFPAIESWNHQDHLGEFTVVVNRRFLVFATATDLPDIATLRALVDRVDFRAIAALK